MLRSRAAAVGAAAALALSVAPATSASAALDAKVTACPESLTSDVGFADVNGGVAFANSIYCLADLGITTGTGGGAYTAQGTLTRRQMATFYYRLACSLAYTPANAADTGPTPDDCDDVLGVAGSANAFGDLGGVGGEQLDAINFLAKTGIVLGKAGGGFDPNGRLTRAQMAAFIDRFQAYAGHKRGQAPQDARAADAAGSGNTGYTSDRSSSFADVPADGGGLNANILDIAGAGITAGASRDAQGRLLYEPASPVTRGQMAEFLARQLESNSTNARGNWVFDVVTG